MHRYSRFTRTVCLRAMEAAHAVWMNTNIFSAEAAAIKARKNRAMRAWDRAVQRVA